MLDDHIGESAELYALGQLDELETLTRQHANNRRIVILTSLPGYELVRWPAEQYEAQIGPDGTVVLQGGRPVQ